MNSVMAFGMEEDIEAEGSFAATRDVVPFHGGTVAFDSAGRTNGLSW